MGRRCRQIFFFIAAFSFLRGFQVGFVSEGSLGIGFIGDLLSAGNKSDQRAFPTTTTTTTVPFSEVMNERRQLLASSCRDSKPGPQGKISLISLHLSSLLPADPAGQRPEWLLYCPVYKAASSNWFHRMTLLSGAANQLKPGAALDQVRNPMDRLVSAYRNKLECRPGKEYYYKEHGQKAVQSYRRAGKLRFGEERYKEMQQLHQQCHTEVEPTFWEFVQYVLTHPSGDPHWKPFTQVCTVCSVIYDYILHFEDLDVEEEQMLDQLGLRKAFPPVRLNAVKKVEGDGPSVTERYMQMLRPEEWRRLVSLYSRDATMFGYNNDIEQLGKSLREKWGTSTQ